MKVVIIGGTRHVGPFIVDTLLEEGHQVCCFNRGLTMTTLPDGVHQIIVDRKIRGQIGDALREEQPDAVIDMIAFQEEEIAEVVTAAPSLKHYVFCGSTVVYGVIGKSTPDESSPIAPDSPYGTDKISCERMLHQEYTKNGFRYTNLRLAHPYGPGDHMLYVTGRESLFLDRMRKGKPVLIPGPGTSRIHPVYARDAARAFVHVLNREECMGQTYNLSGEEILTVDEYYESIARALGVPLVARKIPHEFFRDEAALWSTWKRKPDFGYTWVHYESAFDITALQNTGFRCDTDHDTGVTQMMEWLDKNSLIDLSSDADEEDRILDRLHHH